MLYAKTCPIRFGSLPALILLLMAVFVMTGFGQDPSGRPTDPPTKGGKRPPKRPAAKPEPTPYTVILTVLTDPPGSEVFINGEARGVTNAEGKIQFEKLPLGRYTVEVRKEGFKPMIRGFQAGTESPTLVFKLELSTDDFTKEFDALMAAGKLIGPASPNALEVVEKAASRYPDRPEVARIRGVLAARLTDVIKPVITRTVTDWRTIRREEIQQAADVAAKASALKGDDTRLQAQAAYLKGVLALRDWQAGTQKQNGEGNAGGLALARTELEKAARLEESWAAAHYQSGVVLFISKDLNRAEAAFVKVTQLEPRWTSAYIRLGSTYHDGGKYKDAIEAYRRAIEIDSNNAAAYAGLGLARAMKGEKDAVKDVERAMQLDPASALPNLYLGIILSQSKKAKDLERAVEELTKAIQKNPDNFEFQNSTAEQLLANLQKTKRK